MWVGDGVADGVDEWVDDRVVDEVDDRDEVEVIEEVGVAVVDVEIEAEVDVGVAVVVVVMKEDVAVVVSGVVDATDVKAGEVEPPKVNIDPNGIYSKKRINNRATFVLRSLTLGPK